jgi:hypothetical protein
MATYDVANLPAGWKIVPSKFWGRPVIQDASGNLFCPGFTGNTYSQHPWQSVTMPGVPHSGKSLPRTPGICDVTCDKQREVDKKKAKGSDGARITLAGLQPAKVEIRVHIWTPEQLKELDILRPIIFPGPQKMKSTKQVPTTGTVYTAGLGSVPGVTTFTGGATTYNTTKSVPSVTTVQVTQPFDVYHPVLDSQSVSSLLFIRCTGPTKSDKVPNAMVFTFEAMEWSLPKKGKNATHTPTASHAALDSTLENTGGPPGNNPGTADTP